MDNEKYIMTVILFIFLALFITRTLLAILFHIHLWQKKEYRLDRMREHLRLKSTWKNVFGKIEAVKWVLFAILVFLRPDTSIFVLILLIIYLFESYYLFMDFWSIGLVRPVATFKAYVLLASNAILAMIFFFGLIVIVELPAAVYFIIIDRSIFIISAISVLFFWPVSFFLKKRKIRNAISLRGKLTELQAVGITGSYGKSSVKNILTSLLAPAEQIVTTPGNTNTEIGVAQIVNARLKPKTKFLIAEMGAYRRGEVAKIAAIVRPQIGILTAVSTQHAGLFGSLEKIKEAKYELIKAIPKSGTAIFNINNAVCARLANQTRHCNVIKCGTGDDADIRGKIITENEKGIEAEISGLAGNFTIKCPLFGGHQLENILTAIAAAHVLKITSDKIKDRLLKIATPNETLSVKTHESGALILDDTYNSNTSGVTAAIASAQKINRKNKLILLQPLIELGSLAESEHEKIGVSLKSSNMKIIYCGRDFAGSVKKAMAEKAGNMTLESDPSKIIGLLAPYLNDHSLILLAGRIPRKVREFLLKK